MGEHYLWLAEFHPEVETAGDLVSLIRSDADIRERARKLWLAHTESKDAVAQTLVNAVAFLQLLARDRPLCESLLLRALELEPDNAAIHARLAQFYVLGPPARPDKTLEHAEAALRLNHIQEAEEGLLEMCAVASLGLDELETATRYAKELLAVLQSESGGMEWNRGNIRHKANIVLGRVALRRGDVDSAKQHLLEAGKTEGSPQLDSFGPNMALAQELIAQGERTVIIEYFDLCGKFWKFGAERLAEWKANVEKDITPDFGPNMIY
ncbi:MAG: hypothetical protein WC655_15790 [Candidatus Hydrogenedentales bacterium]